MDPDHGDQIARYRLCGAGFLVSGASLVLLVVSAGLGLLAQFSGDDGLIRLLNDPLWVVLVGLPLSYLAVVGSYLLWGRWRDRSWQRRAGLLVLLNAVDAVVGTLFEGRTLGLPVAEPPEPWLLGQATLAFGWIEFYLMASLAGEVAGQLGEPGAEDRGRRAGNLALAGLVITVLLLLFRTAWAGGRPLQPLPIRSMEVALVLLAGQALRLMAAAQVAGLCFRAAGRCRRTARELVEAEADPMAPPKAGRRDELGD